MKNKRITWILIALPLILILQLLTAEASMASDNIGDAYKYFLGQGLNQYQAAAVVGNLQQESGVDPMAVQSHGKGRGIAQWSAGGRWDTTPNDNATSYASNNGVVLSSLSAQENFTWYELSKFSGYGLADLQASTTVSQAVQAFQNKFEACGTCIQATRVRYAENIISKYGTPVTGYKDGDDIKLAGTSNIYRIAGGAPISVKTCVINGTDFCSDAKTISGTDFGHLRTRPADGTKLVSAGTDGQVWVTAGGAPLAVKTCSIGSTNFCSGYIKVDPASVVGLDHLNMWPANGTDITSADNGQVWRVAGGAPLRVNTCTIGTTDFCTDAVKVDPTAVSNLDHLFSRPINGTELASASSSGQAWVVAGGAPLAVSTCQIQTPNQGPVDDFCSDAVRVDPVAVTGYDHLSSVPSDGTDLVSASTGQVWRVAGGFPFTASACTIGSASFCSDDVAIDGTAVSGSDHLNKAPASGTLVLGASSGTSYQYSSTGCRSVTSTKGTTVVDDKGIAATTSC